MVKYWEIVADRLSNDWLDLGLRVSRGFWAANDLADAHRGDGKRYVVRTKRGCVFGIGSGSSRLTL
jgi:hypothetical protein